jgi:hypothetical protein
MGKDRSAREGNFAATMAKWDGHEKLGKNLTIKDAIHLIRSEGGAVTVTQTVVRLAFVAIVAFFTARAIAKGNATAVHLILPSVTEYLVLLIAMPAIYLFMRHPAMKRDVVGSLWLWGIIIAVAIGWIWRQAAVEGHSFSTQSRTELSTLADWIRRHEMHWPMLAAALGILSGLPRRVQLLFQLGPPFTPVGLGCGMKVAVLFLGIFLAPLIFQNGKILTWAIWGILLAAEILTLVMLWDLQRQLKKRHISL